MGLDLYNKVKFTNAVKNKERRNNEFITGECDIVLSDRIPDIKLSWSLETFPETKRIAQSDAKKSGYDWQLHGYMWLWDKHKAEIAYCMVSTPEEYVKEWDCAEAHFVDHIDPVLRLTVVEYERDVTIQAKIAEKVNYCREYYQQVIEEILEDHK
jgi:hypothetical protein